MHQDPEPIPEALSPRSKTVRVKVDVRACINQLREALRPVVAFKSKLADIQDDDHARLLVLQARFPEAVMNALHFHQQLVDLLVLTAKAQHPEVVDIGPRPGAAAELHKLLK